MLMIHIWWFSCSFTPLLLKPLPNFVTTCSNRKNQKLYTVMTPVNDGKQYQAKESYKAWHFFYHSQCINHVPDDVLLVAKITAIF